MATQVTVFTSYHCWNLTKVNRSFNPFSFNFFDGSLASSLPFLNNYVNFGFDFVGKVSNPCLVWEISIAHKLTIDPLFESWLSAYLNLAKFDLVTIPLKVYIILASMKLSFDCDEATIDFIVLLHTV